MLHEALIQTLHGKCSMYILYTFDSTLCIIITIIIMTLMCNAYHYVQLFLILCFYFCPCLSHSLHLIGRLCIFLYVSCLSSVLFYCNSMDPVSEINDDDYYY